MRQVYAKCPKMTLLRPGFPGAIDPDLLPHEIEEVEAEDDRDHETGGAAVPVTEMTETVTVIAKGTVNETEIGTRTSPETATMIVTSLLPQYGGSRRQLQQYLPQ